MSSTVQQLINRGQKLVTVLRDDPVQKALKLMIEHGYSQLPVVDREGKIVEEKGKAYMVTNDSILSTINSFKIPLHDLHLRVADAMVKTSTFHEDNDLFDLLNDLQDTYAVCILDREQKVIGVVTSYDAMAYFRQRAEDMMLVEDIEETLKKYILAAFPLSNGETNEALTKAIEEIMPSNREMQGRFQRALTEYLVKAGIQTQALQKSIAQQMFEQYLYRKEPTKTFDRLSLNQYIDLFLYESRWSHYSQIFSLERKHIRTLLEDVRDIRNSLAHFRDTVSKQQHETLLKCKNWLEQYETAVLQEFEPKQSTETALVSEAPAEYNPSKVSDSEFTPVEETIHANESRYAPLALFLRKQPRTERTISLGFRDIEHITGSELPAAARQHRSWWANDSVAHVQSQQWLDVDWRVSRINMAEEIVTFTRIEERGKLYIHFFSKLLQALQARRLPTKRIPSPDGTNWMTWKWVPEEGSPVTSLVFSFARYGRFRVELYIDTGDKERNKRLFDTLYEQREVIKGELGELADALEWDRMNDKRGSRIALYHSGAITDSEDHLAFLQEWAVEAMSHFQPTMTKHVLESL